MLSLQLNFGQSLSLFHTVYSYSFVHPAIQTLHQRYVSASPTETAQKASSAT